MSARSGGAQVQLADREVLAPGQLVEEGLAALAPVGFGKLGQRTVQVEAGQVETADHPGEQRETHDRKCQILDAGELVLGLGLRAAHHREQPREDLEFVRDAAVLGKAALQVRIEGLGEFQRLVGREDHLRRARRQLLAGLGRSRLHLDRVALGRACHVQGSADLEVGALVLQDVELVWIEVAPGLLVAEEGVVVPAVPEARDHVDELLGLLVAARVFQVLVLPEVRGFRGVGGGHQVPSRAATREVVQGGEVAGQVVGLVVGGGHGGHQSDVVGDRGQRGEEGDGLEMGVVSVQTPRVGLAHVRPGGGGVRKEQRVEFRRLGRLGQPLVMLEIVSGVRRGIGVSPGGDMVAVGRQEGPQADLAVSCVVAHLISWSVRVGGPVPPIPRQTSCQHLEGTAEDRWCGCIPTHLLGSRQPLHRMHQESIETKSVLSSRCTRRPKPGPKPTVDILFGARNPSWGVLRREHCQKGPETHSLDRLNIVV